MKKQILFFIVVILVGLTGCQQQGPAEDAGERMDEVIDNIKDGDAPFKDKGPMEKMGESIDDAVDGDEDR